MRKIARVARIGAMGGAKPERPVNVLSGERISGGGIRKINLIPEALRTWARVIGEERAERVWRLSLKGIAGTLPELCTYEWLERRRITFEFQSSQMGGRRISGGAVVDFVVYGLTADGIYCWRVQGEYWHKGPDVERKDEVQAARLRGTLIGGIPVIDVIDLWENDVYHRYPEVFERAEAGMGVRG